jgi:hypothetical protein
MKKALTYGAGLIGLYLLVNSASGSGSLLKNGAAGGVSVIKAFQGR